ncbi:MAG: thiamine pyrophosphate-binding protein, partial [Candidatus Omnitrophica bacterium]|nr:thiamine pyrophosphate-binding protein [Candidatus Omnitrophota bacterium]
MDTNEAIVKTLELIGVDHVFGGTGQVNGSMLLALKRSDKIKTIIIRDEQGASFMACGYAMFSNNKLGVCFATGGPGEFNLLSGLAVAYSDSLPVLAISGYTSKPDRGKGALNEDTGLNRTPDGRKIFSSTTKKSFIIEDADATCDILEEAINLAFEGRPGPVHIHVPKNITIAKVSNFRNIKLDIKPVLPKEEDIELAVEIISKAIERNLDIMLLVGYGALRSQAQREIIEFIERFNIPFATTMDAKGIISEDHPLALGVYGTSGDPGANNYFDLAKLVIAIGNSFAQNATFGFKQDLYKGKTLIHINIDPNEINKVYKADCGIISDAKLAIKAIMERLKGKVGKVNPKIIQKEFWYDSPIDYSGNKIHPAELVKVMSRNLPKEAIVLGDAGAHMLWLNCYLHLTQNQRYQNPGSFGPMASHVDAAIGIKCALPDKTVICGCGDGAYQMAGFELMTAVQYNIPVIWVIFNNGEFNVIKKFLLNLFGEEAFMK